MNFLPLFGKRLLSLVFFFVCSNCLCSQVIDHPTIATFQVSYNIDPVSEFVPDSIVRARANVKIQLGDTATVSSVHLKIKNEISDAILYEITYSILSNPVINDSGIVLYSKDGNTIHIIAPDFITLTLYKYEVTTEDANASISPVYSSIQ